MILAAFGCAATYWLRFVTAAPSWAGSITKTLSTALLAVSAYLSGAPALLVAGLGFGAAGDFALSRPGKLAFLAGMAAFAIGHLAYAKLMWTPANAWQNWPYGLVMLALAASTAIWLIPRTGDLRWPVAGYVLIITAMALAALTLPGDQTATAVGAGLFLLSDLLLGIHLFVAPRRSLAYALWPTYWLGQRYILLGSL
ncbi:lysoplasmalogenase [Paracoccus tegillarcae]|uniref:lysoplasmalogenase n=1 Tax=Paracoccus tegillarcae TaxID=1529068 RepID=UPI0013002D68|nr:lysoplasmalogenase [Paracoccus tegillarcae]